MKKFTGTFASLAVITALASPAFAQAPQPTTQAPQTQSPTQAPERQDPATPRQVPKIDMSTERDDSATVANKNMVTGELLKVDTDLMEITVKAADDTEHTFRYADSTKVEGEEGQVSGLATKAGQLVTVHFTEGAGDSRIATKVKFDKK